MTRLTSYWLRVRKPLSKKKIPDCQMLPAYAEIDEALLALMQWTQRMYFVDDLDNLKHNRPCTSQLRKLAPFLDCKNVIRVGRHLRRADLPFEENCPILLPKEAQITWLLIDHVHRSNGHPGAQTIQTIIQRNF